MIGSCSVISVLISPLQWSHPASSVTFFCFKIRRCIEAGGDQPNQMLKWMWVCTFPCFRKGPNGQVLLLHICKGTMIIADQLIPVLMTDGLKGINDDMMLLFALSCSWHSLHQAISSVFGATVYVCIWYMCMFIKCLCIPCSFTTENHWTSSWGTWQARFFLLLGILLPHGWLCHRHPWHPRQDSDLHNLQVFANSNVLATDNGHPLKIHIEFHILQGCRLNLSKVVSPIRCPVEIPLNLVAFGFRCIGHHSCDLCAEYTKEGRSGQVCEWHLNISLTRIKAMNREELLQRLSWLHWTSLNTSNPFDTY